MRLTVDASVIVKWLLSQEKTTGREVAHVEEAIALLDAFRDDRVELIQPPHWLVEVGAVLARLEPEIADTAMHLLDALDIPVQADPEIYTRDIELAVQLNHHLFDTLYHAVALAGPADALVTADMRYFRKANGLGAIYSLAEFIRT